MISVKPTVVGSAASSRIAVRPTQAAKTPARRLRRTTAKTRLAATVKTAVTTTDTLASLVMVAANYRYNVV